MLLYLDDICIFARDISAMLDWIELVFDQLKSFNLKNQAKQMLFFFQASMMFLGHVWSADGIGW